MDRHGDMEPVLMFGRMGGTDGHWAGWVYASRRRHRRLEVAR